MNDRSSNQEQITKIRISSAPVIIYDSLKVIKGWIASSNNTPILRNMAWSLTLFPLIGLSIWLIYSVATQVHEMATLSQKAIELGGYFMQVLIILSLCIGMAGISILPLSITIWISGGILAAERALSWADMLQIIKKIPAILFCGARITSQCLLYLALFSLPGFLILLIHQPVQNSAPYNLMAALLIILGIFYLIRFVSTWLNHAPAFYLITAMNYLPGEALQISKKITATSSFTLLAALGSSSIVCYIAFGFSMAINLATVGIADLMFDGGFQFVVHIAEFYSSLAIIMILALVLNWHARIPADQYRAILKNAGIMN